MALPVAETGFWSLPEEIHDLILRKLGRNDKLRARGVCREWKMLVDKKLRIPKVILTDETVEVFKTFAPDVVIDEIVVKGLLVPFKDRLGLKKRVKVVTVGTGGGFPSCLNNYDFEMNRVSLENLKMLLVRNSRIEELVVSACGSALFIPDPSRFPPVTLEGLRLERLTKLDICVGNPREKNPSVAAAADVDPFLKLLNNHFPNLRNLRFCSISRRASIKQLICLLVFVGAHRRSLRILKLAHRRTTYESTESPKRGGPWYPDRMYASLMQNLRELNLESILVERVTIKGAFVQRWYEAEREMLIPRPGLEMSVVLFDREYAVEVKWGGAAGLLPFHCSDAFGTGRLDSISLDVLPEKGSLIVHPSLEHYYSNLNGVETGWLTRLRFGALVRREDVLWISQQLSVLEEVTYVRVAAAQRERVLEDLLIYLKITTFTRFWVLDHLCPRVERLAFLTPGLDTANSVIRTELTVDRNVFSRPAPQI